MHTLLQEPGFRARHRVSFARRRSCVHKGARMPACLDLRMLAIGCHKTAGVRLERGANGVNSVSSLHVADGCSSSIACSLAEMKRDEDGPRTGPMSVKSKWGPYDSSAQSTLLARPRAAQFLDANKPVQPHSQRSVDPEKATSAIAEAWKLSSKYNMEFDAAMVIVVGQQSAGKTSFVERYLGYAFSVVKHGMATTRPSVLTILPQEEKKKSSKSLKSFLTEAGALRTSSREKKH